MANYPKLRILKTLVFILLGLAFASLGLYVGQTDDAPGAALIGFILMGSFIYLAVKTIRSK
jgi:uncharacterized integral membrane protein